MATPKERCGRLRKLCGNITVEPYMFLYILAAGLSGPAVQALWYRKICLKHFNTSTCDGIDSGNFTTEEDTVQTKTAHWYLYANLAFEIPSIVTSIFYGALGDHVSRKLTLVMPVIGQCIATALFLANAVYFDLPLYAMLLGPLFSGFFGGWIVLLLASYSYVSDVSSMGNRTVRIAVAESALAISNTIVNFAGGYILDHTSFTFVFAISFVVYVLAMLYVVVLVTEPPSELRDVKKACCKSCKIAFGPSAIKKAFSMVAKKREFDGRKHLLIVYACLMLLILTGTPSWALGYLYVRRHPLSWTQTTYGYYLGCRAGLSIVFQLVLIRVMKNALHMRETTVMMVAMVSAAVGEALYGCTTLTWVIFIVPVISIFSGGLSTCLRSTLSMLVEPEELGQAFAVFGSLESAAVLLASLLYNTLYPLTLVYWAGLCFVMGGLLSVFPMALIIWMHVSMKKNPEYRLVSKQTTDEFSESEDDELVGSFKPARSAVAVDGGNDWSADLEDELVSSDDYEPQLKGSNKPYLQLQMSAKDPRV